MSSSLRYDLSQIRYDYAMEMINIFKWLDLVDRVPELLGQKYITLYRKQ